MHLSRYNSVYGSYKLIANKYYGSYTINLANSLPL